MRGGRWREARGGRGDGENQTKVGARVKPARAFEAAATRRCFRGPNRRAGGGAFVAQSSSRRRGTVTLRTQDGTVLHVSSLLRLSVRLSRCGAVSFTLAAAAAAPDRGDAGPAWRLHSLRAAEALREAGAGETRVGNAADEPAEELTFGEFFGREVGDRGLVLSPKLLGLHGKRVVISGYMVREQNRSPGVFVLTPWPAQVSNDGFCLVDEVPPANVHVLAAPAGGQRPFPYRPGRLRLSGILEVGPQPMPDGRNAFARLRLDPEPPPTSP